MAPLASDSKRRPSSTGRPPRAVDRRAATAGGRPPALDERQFDECLPLVNEVLTLVPDEPEAVALNLEAQRGAPGGGGAAGRVRAAV